MISFLIIYVALLAPTADLPKPAAPAENVLRWEVRKTSADDLPASAAAAASAPKPAASTGTGSSVLRTSPPAESRTAPLAAPEDDLSATDFDFLAPAVSAPATPARTGTAPVPAVSGGGTSAAGGLYGIPDSLSDPDDEDILNARPTRPATGGAYGGPSAGTTPASSLLDMPELNDLEPELEPFSPTTIPNALPSAGIPAATPSVIKPAVPAITSPAVTKPTVPAVTAPPASENRKMIASLRELPESTLENVTEISLADFLDRLSPADADVRKGVHAYWEISRHAANYLFWQQHLTFLQELSANSGEAVRLQTAIIAARAAAAESLAALRTETVRLGEIGGFTREIWPADIPHTGAYNTRYDEIAEQDGGSPELALRNRIVGLRYEQWMASAAAYRAAENVFQELRGRKVILTETHLGELLQAAESVRRQRERMFTALIQYNIDVLDYVLEVSGKRGGSLAPLLVVGSAKTGTPTPAEPRYAVPETGGALPAPKLQEKPSVTEAAPPTVSDYGYGNFGDEDESTEDIFSPSGISPGFLEYDTDDDVFLPSTPEAPTPGSDFQPVGGRSGSTGTLTSPPPNAGSRRSDEKSVFRTVAYSRTENTEVSLEKVLKRVYVSERETAAKYYWSYAVLQAQRLVLAHQLRLLAEQRPANDFRFTEAVQALTAEEKSYEAESCRIMIGLSRLGALNSDEIASFPTFTTLPNSGVTQLPLDEFPPGSPRHDRAVHLARHLEFCVGLLSEADKDMDTLLPFIGPASDEFPVPESVTRDFVTFSAILENARAASASYLRLIYTVNSALVSITFAGNSAEALSPAELAKRLGGA